MNQPGHTSPNQFYFSEAHQDRMGFSVIVALAVHVAIIFGIGFESRTKEPIPPSLEITLAQHQTNKQVDTANFLAQKNQQASGTQAEEALMSTPYESPFHDTSIQEVLPATQLEQASAHEPLAQLVTAQQNQTVQYEQENKLNPEVDPIADAILGPVEINRSREIATLQAKLDIQRQVYAKRPRIHRLTSVATKESVDAQYLYQWTRRIEAIGNLNYPKEARARRLFGDLRLLVTIRADGQVETIKILKSSGHKLLDDAAIRIVRLAEPFAPFPPGLREEAELLEIIRTWQFRRNRFSSEN